MVLTRDPAQSALPLWNHSTRMLGSLIGIRRHSKWASWFSARVRSDGVVMNSGGLPESASGVREAGCWPSPSSSAILSMVLSIPFGSCDSRMILRFPAHKRSNDVLLMISIFLSNYYYRIVSYKSVSCVRVGTVPDIVVEPKCKWESIYIVVYILFVCVKFKKELFRWIWNLVRHPKG